MRVVVDSGEARPRQQRWIVAHGCWSPTLIVCLFLGLFYQFDQGRDLVLGWVTETAFPLVGGKLLSKEGLYGKVWVPTDNDAGAGQVASLLLTVGERDFSSKSGASYFQFVIFRRHMRIKSFLLICRRVATILPGDSGRLHWRGK